MCLKHTASPNPTEVLHFESCPVPEAQSGVTAMRALGIQVLQHAAALGALMPKRLVAAFDTLWGSRVDRLEVSTEQDHCLSMVPGFGSTGVWWHPGAWELLQQKQKSHHKPSKEAVRAEGAPDQARPTREQSPPISASPRIQR